MSKLQDLPYQPKPSVIEDPPPPHEGFDYRTHIKNAKTGEMIKVQPYRRFCIGQQVYLERPKHSGNLFFENGDPAGRRIQKNGKWEIDDQAKHIEVIEPQDLTAEEIAAENEALKRELAALKSESEAKMKEQHTAKPQERRN